MQFIKTHPYFFVLLLIFSGGDLLLFLYEVFVNDMSVSEAIIDVCLGFAAAVIVLFVGLKMMGLWRVEID